MKGVLEDREQKPAQAWRDTELTLGPGMLLGILFGLVLLCGLCFGAGFAVGRRNSQLSPDAGAQTAVQADGSRSKPTPGPPAPAQPPGTNTPDQSPLSDSGASPDSSSQATAPEAGGAPAPQPQMRPALPVAPAAPPAASLGAVTPAVGAPPAGSWMVQIAAISHPEDAEVLIGALRRRGYTVTAQHEPADGMIHVRIGPFTTRDEANQWRQKLLGDGYNAIVQP